MLIIGIIALAFSGPEKRPPVVNTSDDDSAANTPAAPAGTKDRFREMTEDWKKKLAEAEAHATEADKIMENAEDGDLPVEKRLGYFDAASEEYQKAMQLYESFCMEYSGCYLFGYDDKYDKVCKKNKNAKTNRINLEERSK